MSVDLQAITNVAALRELGDEWQTLAEAGGTGALFRGPGWLLSWWDAYRSILDGEIFALAGRADGRLVCLAPFYRRTARLGPGIKVREIRIFGDAGPRPPALDILVAPGFEERAGAALAGELQRLVGDWDLIDLEPMQDPSRIRAFLVSRMSASGFHAESSETGGARRIALLAADMDLTADIEPDPSWDAVDGDTASLRKGLSALTRLSRLEWAARDEQSPLAGRDARGLLEQVTLALGAKGGARLARLGDASGDAVASALIVDDGDRAVVLAMAVDPEHAERGVAARLLASEARAAAARGRRALDVVTGAAEYGLPSLPVTRQRGLDVRIFSQSRAAAVARTYSAVRRGVDVARDVPGAAAAGARAAWTKITTTAASVTGYSRLHLYRGELWTRGIEPTAGLELSLFTVDMLDALDDDERARLLETLELDEAYARQKWKRGDSVVLARLGDRPAGITWSAQGAVEVPELSRTLLFGPSEAYIHDVFVAPQARGRNLAPSMLEFLAKELRQRDVYRAWALIGADNIASVRAFEKAAYAAVADVIYARMVDRLTVRPPDPEAKKLLGLT
ncbi:MAG TPA: GNAT family N-acetyltransferase [Kofleriaceae bacterium]|nr:GNAT family N-acetyltransferase [Kofleriaceae bacterium]